MMPIEEVSRLCFHSVRVTGRKKQEKDVAKPPNVETKCNKMLFFRTEPHLFNLCSVLLTGFCIPILPENPK